MKRILMFLFVLSLIYLLLSNIYLYSDGIEVGIQGGWAHSRSSFTSDLTDIDIGSIGSYSAGGYLSFPLLWEGFYFQPEVQLLTKGFNIIEQDQGEEIFSRYKINYIEIPLLFVYRFRLNIRIKSGLFIGPYVGIPGKVKEIQTVFGDTEERELGDNLKEIDGGIVLGGHISYLTGRFNFCVTARYSLGLVNISKNIMAVSYELDEDDMIKSRALVLTFGIGIHLGKNR